MKFLSILALFSALGLAAQQPLQEASQEDPALGVQRVIDDAHRRQFICQTRGGGRITYTMTHVNSAGAEAYRRRNNPVNVGDGPFYPHRFNNREGLGLRGCRGARVLWEYPILTGAPFPGGGREGRDRAIFTLEGAGPGNIKFCDVLHHIRGNQFDHCD